MFHLPQADHSTLPLGDAKVSEGCRQGVVHIESKGCVRGALQVVYIDSKGCKQGAVYLVTEGCKQGVVHVDGKGCGRMDTLEGATPNGPLQRIGASRRDLHCPRKHRERERERGGRRKAQTAVEWRPPPP